VRFTEGQDSSGGDRLVEEEAAQASTSESTA
jgi:hypothetical protein